MDIARATWSNTIGDPELIAVWTDPEFERSLPAVHYARVLEIATALDRLGRRPLQVEDGRGRADDDAGARVHFAHLVQTELRRRGRQ